MKIALLAMPFLDLRLPSIGLTQIKSMLKQDFNGKLDVRIYYINHDFYKYLGHQLYKYLKEQSLLNAIGEWIFRQEAFDNIDNNRQKYIGRYYASGFDRQFDGESIRKIMALGEFIDKVIHKYRLDACDLVGINATFNTLPGLAFCRHLKRINKDIITAMGGACLYGEMGEALIGNYPHVDYVCSGPGLVAFPRLIEAIMNKNPDVTIDGIFSKHNGADGNVNGGRVGKELDIKTYIELDYGDFFESFYNFNIDENVEPSITLETSRGCYWKKCTFCGLNEERKKYAVKRPDDAIKEINYYLEKYKCSITMVDNVIPRSYIKKVLPYIKNPGNNAICYETRADYSKEEMEIISRSGITHIQPGIETLSSDVHGVMNKGVNAFQCIIMLKMCTTYKIHASWNLMTGFPGMTAAMYVDLLKNIPKMTHFVPPMLVSILRFDRYSIYWKQPGMFNLDLRPAAFHQYLYPYDDEFLSKIAYHFEDVNYSTERYRLLNEYYPQLIQLCAQWKKQWTNFEQNIYPGLYRVSRGKEDYIYDSRDNPAREFPISTLEDNILKLLEEPVTKAAVKENFPLESSEDIAAALAHLEDRQLLFEEKGKVLSLVIREYSNKPYKRF